MEENINKLLNTVLDLSSLLRVFFWSLLLKRIGKNVTIRERVVIMRPQNVEIGHDVLLNSDCKIGGQNGIKIGNYVQLAYNVNLVSEDHAYHNPTTPIKKQGYKKTGPIIIEDDVWIGANAVIMPEIRVGRGSIIGANAVVTKSVLPYSIVGGVPARLIKYRFDKQSIQQAEQADLS